MFKRTTAAMFLVTLLLAGCGTVDKEAAAPTTPAASATKTVTQTMVGSFEERRKQIEIQLLMSQYGLDEFDAGVLYTLTEVECYLPQPDGTYTAADFAKAEKILKGVVDNPPKNMQTWLVFNSHGVGCESKKR